MHIEELTQQMEQAMSLAQQQDASQTQGTGSDATKPTLPPRKTVDEVLADLNKSPLFMTELEENDDTAALQALDYEGTPLENGTDFKERGNECFKIKGFGDAKEFYTKGVLILAAEERKRANGEVTKNLDGEPDSEEEITKQRATLETLYVNRAACHLELKNYRSCWTDCAAALRLNPRNLKACYRSARALLAVDRITEADDVCARGLALDESNAPLRAVAADIVKRAQELDARKQTEDQRRARDKRREVLLRAALAARNIRTRATKQPPEMGDTKLELVPDPDDPRSTLAFPTVLLYPQHLESDFIKAFNEQQTLEDHLGYVFPLPWDGEGAYSLASVEAYVETREGGLLKMGKRVPLLKVLASGKVDVVDDVVRIFVVPKKGADEWVAKFKAQKALERGEKT
ncbi:Hsp70/Hsp90 co-chaperone-like protein [Paramyrothecium foliicola]|nr:Hsp70/Hsp90 co-chaperone-like protein [Paramyrothecium foliicola]